MCNILKPLVTAIFHHWQQNATIISFQAKSNPCSWFHIKVLEVYHRWLSRSLAVRCGIVVKHDLNALSTSWIYILLHTRWLLCFWRILFDWNDYIYYNRIRGASKRFCVAFVTTQTPTKKLCFQQITNAETLKMMPLKYLEMKYPKSVQCLTTLLLHVIHRNFHKSGLFKRESVTHTQIHVLGRTRVRSCSHTPSHPPTILFSFSAIIFRMISNFSVYLHSPQNI